MRLLADVVVNRVLPEAYIGKISVGASVATLLSASVEYFLKKALLQAKVFYNRQIVIIRKLCRKGSLLNLLTHSHHDPPVYLQSPAV